MIARLAVVAIVVCLPGCGEPAKPVVAYKKGEYQGKVDSRPWDNEPNNWSGSKWTKGDQGSWENALRQRAAYQNEYARAP